MPGDYATGIGGLTLYRREEPNAPDEEGCAEPHVTAVFQGSESVLINGREYICRPCQCRVTGEDTVGVGHIMEASHEQPFLAASLSLSIGLLGELTERISHLPRAGSIALKKISVEDTDPKILDAFLRLIKLLKKPECLPVLAPDIIYEIHYLLLTGPHGHFLCS